MNDYSFIELDRHCNDKGCLHVAEVYNNIPFEIRRVFYVFGAHEGDKRAGHAHKQCRQVLIALAGEVNVRIVVGDGEPKFMTLVGGSGVGLLVETGVYIEYTMHQNAILLVLASKEYDGNDYFSYAEEQYAIPLYSVSEGSLCPEGS